MTSISDMYCALEVLRQARFVSALWEEARAADEPEEAGIQRVADWQDALERELVQVVAAACRTLYSDR